MKSLKYTALSLTALLLGRIPTCCTANGAAADSTPPAPATLPPEFQKQLDGQAKVIANLQKQIAAHSDNAADLEDEIKEALDKQKAEHAAEIAALQQQVEGKQSSPEPVAGSLAFMAKGAGVELEDVRWRVQMGLDPATAVQAAVLQKEHDANAAKAAKEAAKKK